jgi:hypothetical protein
VSIDTFAKLQSEILDTLNRTDLAADVTEYSPGTIEGSVIRAISKAERRIVRRLKTREFETSSSFSMVAGVETISIPADLAMFKAVILTTSPRVVLVQKDLTSLINDYPSTATGQPVTYAPFGSSLYLRPIPDSARATTIFYYAIPTPLSTTNTSNTILTKYPDLLLYGALIEVTAHVENDTRIQLWKGMFDESVKDITDDNTLNRWSGVPITSTIDVRGVV